MRYFLTCLVLSIADRNVAGNVFFLPFFLTIIILPVLHMLHHYSHRIHILEMMHLLLADPSSLAVPSSVASSPALVVFQLNPQF